MDRAMRVINLYNNKQDNSVYDLIIDKMDFNDTTVKMRHLTRFDGETATTDVELVCSTCTYVERDEQVKRHQVSAAGSDDGRQKTRGRVFY